MVSNYYIKYSKLANLYLYIHHTLTMYMIKVYTFHLLHFHILMYHNQYNHYKHHYYTNYIHHYIYDMFNLLNIIQQDMKLNKYLPHMVKPNYYYILFHNFRQHILLNTYIFLLYKLPFNNFYFKLIFIYIQKTIILYNYLYFLPCHYINLDNHFPFYKITLNLLDKLKFLKNFNYQIQIVIYYVYI